MRLSDVSQMLQTASQFTSALLRQSQIIWLVIIMLGGLVMIGHQTLPPIDRDEARFAQASSQMLQTGDFITVKFQDEYRAKKPAGIYWLQSISAGLFGSDDIDNYRLPSLAGYLISFLLMVAFARSMNLTGWGNLAPLAGGLMLASSFVVFAEAHLAKTDSVLLAALLWQQWALWDIYRRRNDGQAGAAIHQFWVAMGLAILIKGPIGPVVAFGTIALIALFDKSLILLGRIRLLRGLLILAMIVAPWAVSVQIATNGAFLDIAIKGDFLAKIQSGQESHGAPFGLYLVLLPLLAFPASLFFGQLALLGRAVFKRDKGRFAVAWLVGYWLMIELTPTKLPHYILPALPALFLLVLLCFRYPSDAVKWRRITSYGISLYAGLLGMLFSFFLGYGALVYGGVGAGEAFFIALLVIVITGGLLWLFWHWVRRPQSGMMLQILLIGLFMHMLIIAGIIAGANRLHVSTALADAISDLKSKPTIIAAAGYHEPSMVFLLGRDILLVTETEAALLLAESQDGLAIIEATKKETFDNVSAKLGLSPKQIKTVSGFNISKGRDVRLLLYQK